MFEQSAVDACALTVRPWTMVVSLAGQVAMISAAVLWPLVHPDVLQRVAWVIPVTTPPRAYHPPAVQRTDPMRAVVARRVFPAHTVFEPVKVPDQVVILRDPPEIRAAAIGPAGPGVPGGIDFPGEVSRTIENLSTFPKQPTATPARTIPERPAPAVPSKPIKVHEGVQAARLINGPRPLYPALARAARIQGTVHLAAIIGADGRIVDLRALDGHPLLVGAALDAVKHWIYRPTLLNGEPVEVVTDITVAFKLQ
jgi:periplasmic protein TonB